MNAYKIIYALLVYPVKGLFRLKVRGLENLPEKGRGYIICANHTSLLDVFVMEAALDRQVKFMAKKELFSIPVLRSLIRACGAFPVNRGGADVESIKNTISLLEKGDTVGIFPQGTRHAGENPRDTEVKHGVGLMVYRAKCGIIPAYIRTKKNQVKIFGKTELIIGKPVEYEDLGFTEGGMKEYRAAAELVFDRICTLGENADNDKNCQ